MLDPPQGLVLAATCPPDTSIDKVYFQLPAGTIGGDIYCAMMIEIRLIEVARFPTLPSPARAYGEIPTSQRSTDSPVNFGIQCLANPTQWGENRLAGGSAVIWRPRTHKVGEESAT